MRLTTKTPIARALAAIGWLAAASLAQAQDTSAAPAAGSAKAAMCIGCHGIPGYQSSFPQVHKVPMISGQSEKYIVSALQAYKKGDRKHPTMRGIAESLSDQDMEELAKLYASQAAPNKPAADAVNPPAQVAELLKKGNCTSCHGANLNAPIDPSYPKLSGQHADYLYAALKQYQTTNNPNIGRNNAIMAGMARPYTHEELKQIADYIGSLPGELQVVAQSRFR